MGYWVSVKELLWFTCSLPRFYLSPSPRRLIILFFQAQLGEIKLPGIRFAIFFSGFLSLSSKHDSLTLLRIKEFPSMHVFGDADEIVARPKSEKMADMFDVEPLRIAHDGGHVVPSMSKHKEKIAGFMREQLDRKIENNWFSIGIINWLWLFLRTQNYSINTNFSFTCKSFKLQNFQKVRDLVNRIL